MAETTRQKLLKELSEYRWLILQQLADEAEEREDREMAVGWRWLCENKRWPSNRVKNKYGWQFVEWTSSSGEISYRMIQSAQKLPAEIRNYNSYLTTTAQDDLGKLFTRTARAVGRWLIALEEAQKAKVDPTA